MKITLKVFSVVIHIFRGRAIVLLRCENVLERFQLTSGKNEKHNFISFSSLILNNQGAPGLDPNNCRSVNSPFVSKCALTAPSASCFTSPCRFIFIHFKAHPHGSRTGPGGKQLIKIIALPTLAFQIPPGFYEAGPDILHCQPHPLQL